MFAVRNGQSIINSIDKALGGSLVTRSLVLYVILALIFSGCGRISGGIRRAGSSSSVVDFLKTEILANGPVAADGSSQLLVVIQLKNSDNTSVPNYRPTYGVTSSLGVPQSQCTTSDSNGVSTCVLKSIIPGQKTFTLTNAKVGLNKQVEFTAPKGTQRLGLVPACQVNGSTPAGSKIQVSVGNALKGARLKTAGGFQVSFSMQGMVTQ